MRIKPSKFIKHVYSWDDYKIALENIDIIDVHPFHAANLIEEWNIPSSIKKIYTLHGEASIVENLEFL